MKILTKIKNYQNRAWLYLLPDGELDMAASDQFYKKITDELNKHGLRMVWLDFHHITFIDSSGLGVLLKCYRRLAPLNGKMVITHANEQVYRLLLASGMHRIMEIDKPSTVKYAKEGI